MSLSLRARLAFLLAVIPLIGWAQTPRQTADNSELKQIYDADQKDRTVPGGGKFGWSQIAPRDAARRRRVRELIEQNQLRTGADYQHAAMIFQHGDATDDYLLAHVLAVTALGKGDLDARWLAAATLDRYLQKIGQAQIFGTQFSSNTAGGKEKWSMDPYNRTLISPQLREANCVPDPEDQAEMLRAFSMGEEPKPAKKPPCDASKKR